MTKDEALDLALEALKKARGRIVEAGGSGWKLEAQLCVNAITAIKQACSAPPAAPVQPVAEYRGVTNDGHHIIKAMQPLKVGALFYTTPPAQPAPVQPVAWMHVGGYLKRRDPNWEQGVCYGYTREKGWTPLYTTPPAAQPAQGENK